MGKMVRSFRAKMLFIFGTSIFLSAAITYALYKILQYYYYNWVDYGDSLTQFRLFLNRIGDVNFFLLFFIPMSISFFFLFTKRYSAYFTEMSRGIHYLAKGNFQNQIKVLSNDEFGDISKDINLASEKLKEAVERRDFSEKSKDQLVINLAHDLRTPLTSVLGYIDLLLENKELNEEQKRQFLMVAFTKSRHLEKLIDELFDIARMNYGMAPAEKKEINLTHLLSQLAEELYPLFEKNQLIARIDCSRYLPISGNGDLIARLFENLITNAIRYGNDGGYVDIKGFQDKNEVMIQVINYGSAISSKELPFLFDMFYSGDKARTNPKHSKGLGLYIAKNIVDQHNGKITVESNAAYTIFEVQLPGITEIMA